MNVLDVVGIGEVPTPLLLAQFLSDYMTEVLIGGESKCWVRIHDHLPKKTPASGELAVWCRALVQAGGLHCLFNESVHKRPPGAFGLMGVAIASGLVLADPDGSVPLVALNGLLDRYPLSKLGPLPRFKVTKPDMNAPAINAPKEEEKAPSVPVVMWGSRTPSEVN